MGKPPKNKKEFACITNGPLFIIINKKQREGCYIPDGNSKALLGVHIGAKTHGNPGANQCSTNGKGWIT
jgi:hypothetical protein